MHTFDFRPAKEGISRSLCGSKVAPHGRGKVHGFKDAGAIRVKTPPSSKEKKRGVGGLLRKGLVLFVDLKTSIYLYQVARNNTLTTRTIGVYIYSSSSFTSSKAGALGHVAHAASHLSLLRFGVLQCIINLLSFSHCNLSRLPLT